MANVWRELFEELGRQLGEGLARGIEKMPAAANAIRDHYAALYGRCRSCKAPLGGPSPEQICETCHADEVLAAGFGVTQNDGESREDYIARCKRAAGTPEA